MRGAQKGMRSMPQMEPALDGLVRADVAGLASCMRARLYMKAGEDPGADFCDEIERAACSVESVEEEEGEEDDWYKVVRTGERLERQARRAQHPSERVQLFREACQQYEVRAPPERRGTIFYATV